MPITPEEAELRPPPDDQIWMETEEIGLSDGWVRAIIVILALMFVLAIVLPLALT